MIIAWYPWSLEMTERRRYDFPIYYDQVNGVERYGWFYNDKTLVVFEWAEGLDYRVAFAMWYMALAAAGVGIIIALEPARHRYPVLGWCATIGAGVCLRILLCVGNITGLLALACITPLGSLLAMCIKPYLACFVVLHAAIRCHRIISARPVALRPQEQCPIPGHPVDRGGERP